LESCEWFFMMFLGTRWSFEYRQSFQPKPILCSLDHVFFHCPFWSKIARLDNSVHENSPLKRETHWKWVVLFSIPSNSTLKPFSYVNQALSVPMLDRLIIEVFEIDRSDVTHFLGVSELQHKNTTE
jgi:hypothetical protein